MDGEVNRVRRGGLAILKRYVLGEKGKSWGVEYSRINAFGEKYLDRYILYVAGWTLRLHKFWQGDDPRAPHDHPWTFWTMPTRSYIEKCYLIDGYGFLSDGYEKLVRAFRIHRREPEYRHIVVGRADGSTKPFWTVVLTKRIENAWGFYPEPDVMVPHQEWR